MKREPTLQSGQALVLAIALTGVVLLAVTQFYKLADTATARMRQTSSADAAAYSAALVQARALNYMAYLNRAYVAHHLATAHMLSLASWGNFAAQESRQLTRRNPPPSLITMMFGPLHGNAYRQSTAASALNGSPYLGTDLVQALTAHQRYSNVTFLALQQSLQRHFQPQAEAAARAVLAANLDLDDFDANIDLLLEPDSEKPFRTLAANSFVADWVHGLSQQYEFLQPRNHTAYNLWSVSKRCPHLRHQLRRRGRTTLDRDGRWSSADTQSYHALRSNRWILCYYREYEMGWAWIPTANTQIIDAPTVDSPPDDFSDQAFWRWVEAVGKWDIHTGVSNPMASSRARAQGMRLPGSRLVPVAVLEPSLSSLPLYLRVRQKHSIPAIDTEAWAEAYFAHPAFKNERPNIFNPHWQARLRPKPDPSKEKGA
ncbi:hypothetical protein L1889_05380 [Paenalcaligenes niemegkensis]|uniref:hypothetical protein n=1 Tax=Paenalcaligenes niemegkensis TaxID=2895469 RepID=UPI001EE92731|nr:hypothetical protein [Paenalcaligenes niemegkensis]MCQ9616201.1 hypothetical protein [Paenalcaligenes niemegkensis]